MQFMYCKVHLLETLIENQTLIRKFWIYRYDFVLEAAGQRMLWTRKHTSL